MLMPVGDKHAYMYQIRMYINYASLDDSKIYCAFFKFQIKNHFSIPFIIYKSVRNVGLLEPIGVSKPEEEFHVPLDSYRLALVQIIEQLYSIPFF